MGTKISLVHFATLDHVKMRQKREKGGCYGTAWGMIAHPGAILAQFTGDSEADRKNQRGRADKQYATAGHFASEVPGVDGALAHRGY